MKLCTPQEAQDTQDKRLVGRAAELEKYDSRGMKVPRWWKGPVTLESLEDLGIEVEE